MLLNDSLEKQYKHQCSIQGHTSAGMHPTATACSKHFTSVFLSLLICLSSLPLSLSLSLIKPRTASLPWHRLSQYSG